MALSDALIMSSLRRVSTWANIIVALPMRQGLDDVFQDWPTLRRQSWVKLLEPETMGHTQEDTIQRLIVS